jgi:hypothetical protein
MTKNTKYPCIENNISSKKIMEILGFEPAQV